MKEKMAIKTISVIGLGYIGLPTAAMFASKEKKVIGIDLNQNAVDTINSGSIHIVEPELDIIVKKAVDTGFLKATTTPEPADAFLIAVPTPFKADEGEGLIPKPDLSYIKSAIKSVAKVLKKDNIVILESTSPVGTTEKIAQWLAKERSDLTFPQTHGEDSDIRIAHCPERVLPGSIMRELILNDRVIGGLTKRCALEAKSLYEIFVKGDFTITNAKTAEMAKLTENSSRDVQIAFANELSMICDELEINVWELIKIANKHPRVNILNPGPGVGGHCIAVDPWFIISKAPKNSQLIKQARDTNNKKPEWAIKKIRKQIDSLINSQSKTNLRVAILGLAFKPDIDDLRESPALAISEKLSKIYGNMIYIVEPNIKSLPKSFSKAKLIELSSLINFDLVIELVNHNEFKKYKTTIVNKNKRYISFCSD